MSIVRNLILLIMVFCHLAACNSRSSENEASSPEDGSVAIRKMPILSGKLRNDIMVLKIPVSKEEGNELSVKHILIDFDKASDPSSLSLIQVFNNGNDPDAEKQELFGEVGNPVLKNKISGETALSEGVYTFTVSFTARQACDLTKKIAIKNVSVIFSDKTVRKLFVPANSEPLRFGLVLRAAGQDNCDTYRIPGLVSTARGTLMAVYDNRYRNSRDLQDDVDVGMSRSTDGGRTWEPMKVIMDMEEWGGRPQEENGVGDPCILFNHETGTVWVAALWLSGFREQAAWNASGPGSEPSETGQFLLVRSDDDGITWSEEINITSQIKDPRWRLMFQGPGNGITLTDGTMVFPAQFRDADGTPYSTIVWSSDKGASWNIGTGAKSNTTEAQCVQLDDGSIMLNMRDNRNAEVKDENNGRAVSITRDLGLTWETHPSSNSILPEPVCMASLISTDMIIDGRKQKVLFFSNPNNKYSRSNMTIKASLDEGMTWPEEFQVELNEEEGYGYSCLAMVDENHIGILYEGIKELYFQKIPVKDILKEKL
ncbi:MAG: sialidase family protein [Bacteroidales bacterium]|jgi:sialidase-1